MVPDGNLPASSVECLTTF